MTKEKIKELLVDHITAFQGCKATELAVLIPQTDFRPFNFMDLIEELIAEKRIIEISYVLSNMDYREKSFYLPGDTKINISGTGV